VRTHRDDISEQHAKEVGANAVAGANPTPTCRTR
jgi:hypothetical protein